MTGILLWLFYHHGTAAWLFWLELILGSAGGALLLFHSVLWWPPSFFSFVSTSSLCSRALKIKKKTKKNDRHPSLSFWDRGFGLCRRHCFFFFFSLLPSSGSSAYHRALFFLFFFVLSMLCDPCVGGGASREHRGANEALGMPAGGEEPGAATGESRRRRRARAAPTGPATPA